MKTAKTTLIALITILSLLGSFGCSGKADPMAVSSTESELTSAFRNAEYNGRVVMGAFNCSYDSTTNTIQALPSRELERQVNITNLVGKGLKFENIDHSYETGQLLFDLVLTNNTKFTVFDVRAIFIQEPGSGAHIQNADDYTAWFNLYQGSVNGFKAYAENSYKRSFSPGGSHSRQFILNDPYQEQPSDFLIFITCSFPGNCQDPYEIKDQTYDFPVGKNSPTTITVEVLDHQENVERVTISTYEITGGDTEMTYIGNNKWSAMIMNTNNAESGLYDLLITADSYFGPDQQNDSEKLFDIISIPVD